MIIEQPIWEVSFEERDEMGWCTLTKRVVADTGAQAISEVRASRANTGHFGVRNFTAVEVKL